MPCVPGTNSKFQNYNKTCVLLFHLWMFFDSFFYKAQTKQTSHITAHKVNYHMTWLTTNNKCLKPSYFLEIQPMTKYITHQDWTPCQCYLEIFCQHPALPCHTFPTSHWLPNCRGCFSSSLIGHQGTWFIIISHFLLNIPGICIASHPFMTSRSLDKLSQPCSILLKNILC